MFFFFFFNDTATTEIYTLSLHDALPISFTGRWYGPLSLRQIPPSLGIECRPRSEEHTSELQSQSNLVCRLLLEKKKRTQGTHTRRRAMHTSIDRSLCSRNRLLSYSAQI